MHARVKKAAVAAVIKVENKMAIKEQLMEELKIAMREKDVIRKNAVQNARSAVLQVEKDTKTEVDDDGIIDIISKMVKKLKDASVEFEKGGRQDLVDNNNREIEVLSKYLPEQLSDEDLTKIIKDVISETGAESMKDMGKVMGIVIQKTKGKADGGAINRIVKEMLS